MEAEWPVSIDGIEPVELIGSGGFGQVWLAKQTDLDRSVAVKIGHRPFTTDDDRRRFERECMALGRLSGHANILDVYTSGLSAGLPYLVLAYVEGGTLADHGPSLGEARLRTVTDQLCQAVGAAHAIGVLHRDLKPENVFLALDGTAVLGDFGIARLGDGNNTEAAGVTASMAFAPPEILEGRTPSPAADVYGIGVTIMSAVLGRSPFVTAQTTTLEAIIAQVLRGDMPSLAAHGISPGFEALLRRAMDKDPARRPPSALDLRNELLALPAVGAAGGVPTQQGAPVAPVWQPPVAPTHGHQSAPSQQVPAAYNQQSTAQPQAGHPQYQRPTTGQEFTPAGANTGPGSGPGSSKLTTIGIAAGAGLAALVGIALLILALRPDGSNEPVAAAVDGDQEITATGEGEATTETGEDAGEEAESVGTTTSTTVPTTTSTTAAPTPLGIPLTGAEISDLIPIPFDFDDLDPLLGPADSPQFCDNKPDITGLTETVAAIYPTDPTVEASLRQVAQRMHRFSTPEQASNFIASYTTIDCESWETDGFTTLTAQAVIPPSLDAGDEIAQVDQVSTLPIEVDILSRTILIRSGADVYKLVFFTIASDEVGPLSDILVTRAVENLGY